MQYTIHGELAQVANLTLENGDTCWASKGSIVAMDPGLGWILKVPGGASGAARRMMSGEGVALTFLEATADGQRATLAANQPGKIVAWNLDDGPVITTRGSFVSAFGPRVDIDVRVAKRAGAAFFGGAGLFLQHISGSGTVLVHGSGDFIERNLAEGEVVAGVDGQPRGLCRVGRLRHPGRGRLPAYGLWRRGPLHDPAHRARSRVAADPQACDTRTETGLVIY